MKKGERKESFSSLSCTEILSYFSHLWIDQRGIISLNPTMTKYTTKNAEIVLPKFSFFSNQSRRMLMMKV